MKDEENERECECCGGQLLWLLLFQIMAAIEANK